MISMTIQEKMRISSVQRWHIVPTSKEQTLADHTCRVQILAMDIAMALGYVNENMESGLASIMFRSLVHDIEEITKGDIPGHTKRHIRDEFLPTDMVRRVVKLADVLESYYFIHQYHIDRHGKEVTNYYAMRFANLVSQLPDREREMMNSLQSQLFSGDFNDV